LLREIREVSNIVHHNNHHLSSSSNIPGIFVYSSQSQDKK